jgi:hypothetical protein
MWIWRPGKWLLWAPIMAGLPYLAAAWLNTASLNKAIADDVVANLAAVGAGWAKPAFDARDVRLGGDAPSDEAIDAAVAAVRNTSGVRVVTEAARVVAPLPPATVTSP